MIAGIYSLGQHVSKDHLKIQQQLENSMFGFFKKKETREEALRASLAKRLEAYTNNSVDETNTNWTEITLHGEDKKVRVPKYTATAVEELTLADFNNAATVCEIPRDDFDKNDPWAVNTADAAAFDRQELRRARAKRHKR